MTSFTHYAKIKDSFCICYFGHSHEYLVQLRLIKPLLEKHLPGLNITLCCRDDQYHLIQQGLKLSEFAAEKNRFAYVFEVNYNHRIHPILDLLNDTGISDFEIHTPMPTKTVKAVIISEGCFPTKSMELSQVKKMIEFAKEQGFDPEINSNIDNAGLVIGVESCGLFEAGSRGIRTILVPTGIGTRLYKGMFPKGEVLV